MRKITKFLVLVLAVACFIVSGYYDIVEVTPLNSKVTCSFVHDHTEVDENGNSVCGYKEASEGVEAVVCSVEATHEHNSECNPIQPTKVPVGEIAFNWLTKGTVLNIFIFRMATLGAGLICVILYIILGKTSKREKKNKKRQNKKLGPVVQSSIPESATRTYNNDSGIKL